MTRSKIQRNLDHLIALTRLLRTESPDVYDEALTLLRREGWKLEETPRCHDFAAAREALEGAAQ